MFKIDRETNDIQHLKSESFSSLGFKERAHLQEWIAKTPTCLGEDLPVIQKEFAGFSDTQERLDLLAIDKFGCLVIIENKLDDTGKDVTWQALKYASYCSSLSNDNIAKIFQDFLIIRGRTEKSEDLISEFIGVDDFQEVVLNKGFSQRVILVAANFRKEVTSTVMWLMNYKMKIQCFKATPYSRGDDLFLSMEQIIPAQDTEEFLIGLADKALSEARNSANEKNRHKVRRAFWSTLIPVMQEKSSLYNNISPGISGWIGAGSGMRSVSYNFAVSKSYGRAEIYINRGDREENNWTFDKLFAQKDEIESVYGGQLVWERMDNSRACRIKAETEGNVYDEEFWPEMIEFMTDAMVRVEAAFRQPLAELNTELKAATNT